jgi:hypothetical protein
MQALKAYLQANASPTFALPALRAVLPTIRWSGPVANANNSVPATTLPNGTIFPATHPSIGGPIRDRLTSMPGNPTLNGYPCLTIGRPYTCKGSPRSAGSRSPLRIKTDAPVIELTGVTTDAGAALPVLIVDGELVPPVAFSSSRGDAAGGWTAGTLVVDFGTRAMRDIWIETVMWLAHIKIDANDTLLDANDQSEPQFTVVGDSYLQTHSNAFPFDEAIALEMGARLGVRKIAVDAIGGSGYYNTSNNLGNLNDRLPAHAADNSIVYVVMAGLNDYADVAGWPSRADYERSVYDYMKNLRAAQPKALIVATAPFCPVPPWSDTAAWIANAATNTSGLGDYLYKARLQKDAVQQIAGPWVFIDVLLGGGWLNSSGRTGDITGLQWFTGGNALSGSPIGGGGGFGGIRKIPILSGGKYSRAPNLTASGGTGQGAVLLTAAIDSTGALSSITVHSGGYGYTAGTGLPTISIDPTYVITPAVLGTPEVTQGFNPGPDADYPLPANAPLGATDLNNIDRMLAEDRTHPSVVGVEYLGKRLAENIYQAVMGL